MIVIPEQNSTKNAKNYSEIVLHLMHGWVRGGWGGGERGKSQWRRENSVDSAWRRSSGIYGHQPMANVLFWVSLDQWNGIRWGTHSGRVDGGLDKDKQAMNATFGLLVLLSLKTTHCSATLLPVDCVYFKNMKPFHPDLSRQCFRRKDDLIQYVNPIRLGYLGSHQDWG